MVVGDEVRKAYCANWEMDGGQQFRDQMDIWEKVGTAPA